MADDLSDLGVSWVEESSLREDVVAAVDAHGDMERAADEAELQRRWAALEEMERVVAELQEQCESAKLQAGVVVLGGGVGGAAVGVGGAEDKKKMESGDGEAVLRFRLAKAQREVESRATAVRRWQKEMETRQRQRAEAARRRRQAAMSMNSTAASSRSVVGPAANKTTPAGPSLNLAASLSALTPAASAVTIRSGTSTSTSTTAAARRRSESKYPPGAFDVSNNITLSSLSGIPTLPQSSRDGGNNNNTTSNNNSHSGISSSSSSGSLTGGKTFTSVAEYAGGALLPSLHRVTLSRAELRSTSKRYADDGDIDAFHARQEKRKRLEEVAACVSASHPTLPLSGGVKKEENQDGISVKVKQEKKNEDEYEEGKTGTSHTEAIDVDAIMEESDEIGENILRQVTVNQSGISNNGSIKKEEREKFVSLVPGITLCESIYSRLLDHQREGVKWMLQLHVQKVGGILGDEMGLGKTIQVAAMLNALHNSQQLRGPCLIVSPLTVLQQWVMEMHRWAPYMRTCIMHESSASKVGREELIASIRGTPAVLLTTYAGVRQHCQLLHTARFQYIILDEGHKISNPDTTVTLAVKSFPTPHRLILSGTPIQNTLKELWCLFDFVKPGLLGTMTKFVQEFEEPINASKDLRASSLVLATAVECARALQERISPYLLRRLKRQVMKDALPQKYERVIRCPLSDAQLEAYVELLTSPRVQQLLSSTLSYTQMMGALDRDGRDSSGSLHTAGRRFQMMARHQQQHNGSGIRPETFRVLNELRQICNHVDVFRLRQSIANGGGDDYDDDDDDGNDGNSMTTTNHNNNNNGNNGMASVGRRRRVSRPSLRSNLPVNYDGSGKLQTLRRLLTVWRRGGQRALIFSQTRLLLDVLENMCEQEGLAYIRLDGSTGGPQRQALIHRFNTDPNVTAALLTTRVGGVGVNLTGADRVVLVDPDWNPVTDEQARERAWRIGQTRDVGVYRLIASGTVEEAILRRQLAKTYVTEKVLSNPTLQRFFHQHENLAETFYLGAEYDSRIPVGKKHVMVAQELSPLLEKEEEEEEEEEEEDKEHTNVNRNSAHAVQDKPEVCVKQEKGVSVYRVRPPMPINNNNNNNNNNPSHPNHINNNNNHHHHHHINNNTPRRPTPKPINTPPTVAEKNRRVGGGANWAETALLQDLVDGQEVRISGDDAVARRLARLSATQTMLRVTNTVRTMEQQQAEMRIKLEKGED
ncbi:DNA excision repair protein [Trypanosoma theileri]|uniref:DNA excision repair protein n=1 Tax=Trypanosoma theileri TaxID=67003 RepID=A0A1X0NNJ7_9TRYP|nr:DNA excision repair protein [Trypanosoma theileri]ORC86292.1 DNA excision repair protein [Trypanosoma theileri]